MSYKKNTSGQKFNVLAVNTATGLPVAGDAANITAKISIDSAAFASVSDTNPTELDATNAPGVYVFDLSQAETNGDVLTIVPSSTTANVQLDMLNIYTTSITGTDVIADAVWDEILTGATHNIATSAGRRLRQIVDVGVYEGGQVWIDTVNGTAGTNDYENGTVDNPSNNIADATTIANSVGITRFKIAPNSSFTLASAYTGFSFFGDGRFDLNLGGQQLNKTSITHAIVSGTCTTTDEPHFEDCDINTVTLPGCEILRSRLNGTITLSDASTYSFDGCFSGISGTASPVINFGLLIGNTSVNMRHYSGGIEVQNMGQAGTDVMSLEGDGQLIINANCTGGSISLRGNFKVTDNSGGAVTIIRDDNSANITSIKTITDALPDSGALTSIATASALATVDTVVDAILVDTGTTIPAQITGVETKVDGVKATTDQFVFTVANQVDANCLTGGLSQTEVAQAVWNADISTYQSNDTFGNAYRELDGGTTRADVYRIDSLSMAAEGLGRVWSTYDHDIDIASSTPTSVTFNDPGIINRDEFYTGMTVLITQGQGQGQARLITAYDGTTKTATIYPAWSQQPGGGLSDCTILGGGQIIDVSTLATSASISALNDFDPANDTVANVTLVGTCTTNTDMRGTDNALLATSVPTNFGDLAITATTGKVTVGTNDDKTGYTLVATPPTSAEIYTYFTDGTREDLFKADVSSLATSSALTTVDTVVDAIKAKTDSLTFTVPNQVDANALTGGTSAASIYTYFTSGSNEDAFKADVSALATSASISALNDFDPANDTVAHVTLVDTTTTNTDMRGTDSAATASSLAIVDGRTSAILADTGTDIPAQISALNDFDPSSDTVARVTLVDTVTTNTDMRGTDGANTTTPPSVANIVSGISSETYDGVAFEDVMKILLSMAQGKIVESSSGVFEFYAQDNATLLYTLTKSGSQRNRS